MPANVETMFYTGETPWHRQGVRLDRPATSAEAITAAGLDWEVQRQKLYTGLYRETLIKDRYVVCRTDRLDEPDGGQLGVVGRDYRPLQNADAFAFLDPLVGENAAVYHTAGSLRCGRQIWMLAKLPGVIRVAGDDITEKFILLSNSHDGTSAVTVGLTPIRVVCQNTLNLALRNMGGISIRHHQDVADRVKEAHRLLGLFSEQYDRAEPIMQRMAMTPMVGGRLREYFERVMPMPVGAGDDVERERAKVQQRHNRWSELFENGDGNQLPGVRGSQWAAYNATTQWADRESYTSRTKEPLTKIWFGDAARLKERAFDIAEQMLGVWNN